MAQGNRLTKEEIKRDQFVESVLNVYNFLKTHLKFIIIAAAVVVVLVAGFSIYSQEQQERRLLPLRKLSKSIKKRKTVGWIRRISKRAVRNSRLGARHFRQFSRNIPVPRSLIERDTTMHELSITRQIMGGQ